MTVTRLCQELTVEEMTAWAAFFEIKGEEQEKTMERAKMSAKAQSTGRR